MERVYSQKRAEAARADRYNNPLIELFRQYQSFAKLGKFNKAIEVLMEINSLIEKAVANDPYNKVLLENRFLIGTTLKEAGRRKESQAWMKKLMTDYTNAPWEGASHKAARVANIISSTLFEEGNYSDAVEYANKSISLNNPTIDGYDKEEHNSARYYLAQATGGQGDVAKSRELLEQLYNELPQGHLKSAAANNLGVLYIDANPDVAKKYLLNSLIGKQPDFSYAITAANIGAIDLEQGRPSDAVVGIEAALEIINWSPDSPRLSQVPGMLESLGVAYTELRQYKKAQESFARALRSANDLFGEESITASSILVNRATSFFRTGNVLAALADLRASVELENDWMKSELPLAPDRLRQRLRDNIRLLDFIIASLSRHGRESWDLNISAVLSRKGLLQEIQAKQAELARKTPDGEHILQRLRDIAEQLSAKSTSINRRLELRKKSEEAQRELYRKMPRLELQPASKQEVAKLIPKSGALIEFQRYWEYDPYKPRNKRWGEARYQALVLDHRGRVNTVQLGPALSIDKTIHKGLIASAEAYDDAEMIWEELSLKILSPIIPYLNGIREWFISPDSELHRVPFAALPAPQKPGTRLASMVNLRVLTTGRELLQLQKSFPISDQSAVFANPDYSQHHTDQETAREQDIVVTKGQIHSFNALGIQWRSLPRTQEEGEEIARLLNARLMTGSAATTANLMSQPAPRVLHIATHGFFGSYQESKPSYSPLRSIHRGTDSGLLRSDDPGLLSGLVLAGANQPNPTKSDDGYLTATELLGLKLNGTELVVLSACSTGQGEVSTGEGLYGLQRSLAVAGARSTLLSLWKVDDSATKEFMTRFYKRLKTGEGRADALAAVQKEFRNGIPGHDDWKHPYFWAAWQLVGDWRPIKGL
ncbi:CHAT domain-containing protein [Synechococcus sp. FGCU-3]|nr:CHAT domain-containing protein [Synechococcus sp. FGCU3]